MLLCQAFLSDPCSLLRRGHCSCPDGLGAQKGQVTSLLSHSQEAVDLAWSSLTGQCQRWGERGWPWVPGEPSEPIFCPCGSLPAILTLPMPPSAQVPHRPCPVGCPGWDTSRPLEMIPRLSHSALHTAGVQDALCFLLGGPSAWLHHREGSPELPGGRAVGVTN